MMDRKPTFISYIDESGDEGFRFGQGSSEWFVLSGVILRRANELNEVKLVDEVRNRINAGRKPDQKIPERKALHFRDLKHEQRKFYSALISKARLRTVSILIHKPSLTSPENFTQESKLYFYAVRLLVERVSWCCRDHRKKDDTGNGSVELVLSNRASMDYKALCGYIEYLDANRVALGYQADADVVRPDQIGTFTHGRRMGLQVADAVASAYFYAVQTSAYGMTEDGYARLLLPCAYRHQKRLWGYGVKVMPREAEERRRTGAILPGWES